MSFKDNDGTSGCTTSSGVGAIGAEGAMVMPFTKVIIKFCSSVPHDTVLTDLEIVSDAIDRTFGLKYELFKIFHFDENDFLTFLSPFHQIAFQSWPLFFSF